ncbi:DUF2827 family protein [Comamonas sp. C24C]
MLKKTLNIGISFFGLKEGQSIWSNGAIQNCFFLYWLLQKCPSVGRVSFVKAGDGTVGPLGIDSTGMDFELVEMEEAIVSAELDVLIEMGAQLQPEIVRRVRDKGTKVISYRVGNDYVMEVERVIAGREGLGIFNGVVFDEVWTNQQHIATCKSFFEIVYRCPVHVVPHIWSPFFIDRMKQDLPEGTTFGYAPGKPEKNISIFEPNINVLKTSHYPMIICEAAYRKSSDGIGDIFVTNSLNLKKHQAFEGFSLNLDIVQSGKASFEARFGTPYFFSAFTDIVLTHQWENALNYLYYDAAYGRYPLVHNSDLLGNFGYRYASFDALDGAEKLRTAICTHDLNLDSYDDQCRNLLNHVSIFNVENIAIYDDMLCRLCADIASA